MSDQKTVRYEDLLEGDVVMFLGMTDGRKTPWEFEEGKHYTVGWDGAGDFGVRDGGNDVVPKRIHDAFRFTLVRRDGEPVEETKLEQEDDAYADLRKALDVIRSYLTSTDFSITCEEEGFSMFDFSTNLQSRREMTSEQVVEVLKARDDYKFLTKDWI